MTAVFAACSPLRLRLCLMTEISRVCKQAFSPCPRQCCFGDGTCTGFTSPSGSKQADFMSIKDANCATCEIASNLVFRVFPTEPSTRKRVLEWQKMLERVQSYV